jgi:hypothetical protein
MAYSKAKMKSSGDQAFLCFKPFWIQKLSENYVRVEVFTAVTMKNGVFFQEPHGVKSQKTPFFIRELFTYMDFTVSFKQ